MYASALFHVCEALNMLTPAQVHNHKNTLFMAYSAPNKFHCLCIIDVEASTIECVYTGLRAVQLVVFKQVTLPV